MRVDEVMTKDVETISPDETAVVAWDRMRQAGIHHLVVTRGPKIVGILSDRDIGGRRGESVRARASVEDLMTRAVVTVAPTDTIRRVANMMRGRTIGCMPVVARRRIVGIVTVSDLLLILGGGADRPAPKQRAALHYRSPHRKRHGSRGAW